MWRVRHLKVIERVIGGEVVGTQGTPVELLVRSSRRTSTPSSGGRAPTSRTPRRSSTERLTSCSAPDESGAAPVRADRGDGVAPIHDDSSPRSSRARRAVARCRVRHRGDRAARGARRRATVTGRRLLGRAACSTRRRPAGRGEGLDDPVRASGDCAGAAVRGRVRSTSSPRASADLRAAITRAPRAELARVCRPGGRLGLTTVVRRTRGSRRSVLALRRRRRRGAARRSTGARRRTSSELLGAGVRPRVRARRRAIFEAASRRGGLGAVLGAVGRRSRRWRVARPGRAATRVPAGVRRASTSASADRASIDMPRHVPARHEGRAADDARATRSTQLLQELIRLDTVNPPGNETAAAEHLRGYLEANGVACELYAKMPERANLVGAHPRPRRRAAAAAALAHRHGARRPGRVAGRPVVGRAARRRGLGPRRARHEGPGRGAARWPSPRSRARASEPAGDLIFAAAADEEVGEATSASPWLCREHPERGARRVLRQRGRRRPGRDRRPGRSTSARPRRR